MTRSQAGQSGIHPSFFRAEWFSETSDDVDDSGARGYISKPRSENVVDRDRASASSSQTTSTSTLTWTTGWGAGKPVPSTLQPSLMLSKPNRGHLAANSTVESTGEGEDEYEGLVSPAAALALVLGMVDTGTGTETETVAVAEAEMRQDSVDTSASTHAGQDAGAGTGANPSRRADATVTSKTDSRPSSMRGPCVSVSGWQNARRGGVEGTFLGRYERCTCAGI